MRNHRIVFRRGRPVLLAALFAGAALVRCTGDDASDCDASCPDAAALGVSLAPQEIWVHPGSTAEIQIALARGPGGDGDAVVTIEDEAGAGVTADALTIPAGSTVGTLAVHVAASFAQGDDTVAVDARVAGELAQASLRVHVGGASGAPDTSFGAGGVVDLAPSTGSDVGAAMIALQDGVLVGGTHLEAGDAGSVSTMKLLRLTSGGGIDGAFAVTSAPGELASLAMLPDGRVFAVGDVRSPKADFAAVRVLAAGGLDPTYAVDTPVTLGDDVARAAIVEPGGRLAIAGSVADASAFGVARYTQVPLPPGDAGTDAGDAGDASPVTSHLDPTFGDGGLVVTTFAKPSAGATSMLVAPDGSLYVLGFESGGATDVVAVHYDPSGAATSTTTLPLATGTYGAAAALLQPDGAIVVASDDGGQALALRLLPSGVADPSFGVGGLSTLAVGASSGARALARDPASGNLYVGGFSGSPHECFVARVTPAGALDASYAVAGVLTIAQGDSCDVAALAVDGGGKLLVLAMVASGSATRMVVARYW